MNQGRIEVLQKDYSRMELLRERSGGLLDFEVHNPGLPVIYLVDLHCKGVRLQAGLAKEINRHQVAINLPPNYPIEQPILVWRTPILHPNILPPGVCLLSRWGAKTRLDEVCLWLWDMARYRLYNLNDPLDKAAAKWAKQYEKEFPLDKTDLRAIVAIQAGRPGEPADGEVTPRGLSDAEFSEMIKVIPAD